MKTDTQSFYGKNKNFKSDEKGNLIYYTDNEGYECWWTYNEKNQRTHFRNNQGSQEWYSYDEKGREIHYKNTHEYEEWYSYDEKGNMTTKSSKVKQ